MKRTPRGGAELVCQYATVRDGLHSFFIGKENVVYEKSSFNLRKQGENETVDSSVTDLYSLAERCNYVACFMMS